MTKLLRDDYIMIKVSTDEKNSIAEDALSEGMTISAYLRMIAIQKHKENKQ